MEHHRCLHRVRLFHKICQDQPHKEAVDSLHKIPVEHTEKCRSHKCCCRGRHKFLAPSIENAAEKVFLQNRGCRQKHHSLQPEISRKQALIRQHRARDLKCFHRKAECQGYSCAAKKYCCRDFSVPVFFSPEHRILSIKMYQHRNRHDRPEQCIPQDHIVPEQHRLRKRKLDETRHRQAEQNWKKNPPDPDLQLPLSFHAAVLCCRRPAPNTHTNTSYHILRWNTNI